MSHRLRLVVTDLDNTLYDWATYFATSFTAMVDELVRLLAVDREELLDQFREVHRRYHNSEYPFAVLEVPLVRQAVGSSSDAEILNAVDSALHAFNRARKETLKLYPGVVETLGCLHERGVTVVGHTEATVENAYFRLETLSVRPLLKHLYALEGHRRPHPRGGPAHPPPPSEYIQVVPQSERKPNPRLLRDICDREGVAPDEVWYVGDSLTRDISMAKDAGVKAVWARYGTEVDPKRWAQLVRITHWTEEDVRREAELKRTRGNVDPDATLDRFPDLLALV